MTFLAIFNASCNSELFLPFFFVHCLLHAKCAAKCTYAVMLNLATECQICQTAHGNLKMPLILMRFPQAYLLSSVICYMFKHVALFSSEYCRAQRPAVHISSIAPHKH